MTRKDWSDEEHLKLEWYGLIDEDGEIEFDANYFDIEHLNTNLEDFDYFEKDFDSIYQRGSDSSHENNEACLPQFQEPSHQQITPYSVLMFLPQGKTAYYVAVENIGIALHTHPR